MAEQRIAQRQIKFKIDIEMYGILLAMPTEARCFNTSFRTIGELYPFGPKTLIAVSGMGELARQAALALLKKKVTCLVSCGTAVGLAPHLKSGTLCVPQQIIDSHGAVYHCDHRLREQARVEINKEVALEEGTLIHTSTILKTRNEKQELYQKSGALASDMESLFIAEQAKNYQIPFLALRAVIDEADFTMPKRLMLSISASGEVSRLKIFLSLCIQPSLLFPLLTLASNFNKTRKVLKSVSQLDMFIS